MWVIYTPVCQVYCVIVSVVIMVDNFDFALSNTSYDCINGVELYLCDM